MEIRKNFFIYLVFLLYMELVFHFFCFSDISFSNLFLILFNSIAYSCLLTIGTSLFKNKKINSIISKILISLILIVFAAELVYFKIYESFFSIKGIYFIGALKDGYDKIFATILENIFPIILFIIPIVLLFIKLPKKTEQLNKVTLLVLIPLFLLVNGYNYFIINYINKEQKESYYHVYYNINRPTLNTKYFGLIESSFISIQRMIFGFNEKRIESEDILINKRTALADTKSIKYNETDIDFNSLLNTESNQVIKDLHNYFSNQIATNQNEYTGIFKDKNVIFIVAESFDEIAIDKELTPTLYNIKNNGIKFNNYFAPKYPASTADGEYMLEWGTLPIIGENYSLIDMVYNTNPYILPRILKNNNYKTYAYHNYFGYYNYRKKYFSTLDFDGMKFCEDGISTRCDRFHGSDIDMMRQTIDDYINQDKFFAYYITLSGHGSYDSSNYIAQQHLDKVNHLDMSSKLKYYLAANIDFDLSMEILINKLKEANKLDDTVIIISSDHSPYYLTNAEVNKLSSIDRDNKFDRNRGSLIIYNSELTGSHDVDKYSMNIDVLPTTLNMLGLEYDSRLIIGKDIMSTNIDGLVVFPDRSWANNNGAYDSVTKRFTPYITSSIDDKYIEQITQEVNEKYQVSTTMQYNDYYKYIFKD